MSVKKSSAEGFCSVTGSGSKRIVRNRSHSVDVGSGTAPCNERWISSRCWRQPAVSVLRRCRLSEGLSSSPECFFFFFLSFLSLSFFSPSSATGDSAPGVTAEEATVRRSAHSAKHCRERTFNWSFNNRRQQRGDGFVRVAQVVQEAIEIVHITNLHCRMSNSCTSITMILAYLAGNGDTARVLGALVAVEAQTLQRGRELPREQLHSNRAARK